MSDLTEIEILTTMKHNLALAVEHCELLAKLPMKGMNFGLLRQELKLVEGCCRQMAAWREDSRWLPIGVMMEQAHQRARAWVDTKRGSVLRGRSAPLFLMLADNLRGLILLCTQLETAATGRVGMILPEPIAHHRETRPVQVGLPN